MTSDKLKPCPFCGGKARVEAIGFDDDPDSVWWVRCTQCWACTAEHNGGEEAEREAIKAWNKRAERTCKPIWCEDGFACNKCGYWWPLKHYDNGKPCYCPNCGAKVVER